MTVFVCVFCCVAILSQIIEFFLFRNGYLHVLICIFCHLLYIHSDLPDVDIRSRIVYKLSVKHVKF